MLVYRENTEGEYAPVGGRLYAGHAARDRHADGRLHAPRLRAHHARRASRRARSRRKKLTSITKSNAQVYSMVLWDEVFARRAPRTIPTCSRSSLLVDAAAMDFVRKPETFDVVVASNLFGDILTDLSAIVTGSIGLAASANINPERTFPSMFEPVHGSAPDIAGKGIANPLAAILSAGMMLDHLGLTGQRQGGSRRGGHGAEGRQAAHARPGRHRQDDRAGRCRAEGAIAVTS